MRDGTLWRVRDKMVVQLTDEEVKESSTYRELVGTDRLDLAVIPASCKKAVVGMDAMASVQCLWHGSKVEILQRLVRRIFLRQLRHNRILFPLWLRRSEDLLVMCDAFSRLVDAHKYAMPAATFWRANDMAITIWGRGFQIDVCADMHNVQPIDSYTKLPFFSRWCSPHSSGVDMFSQNWRNTVNWCNPPFVVIPRVISLLRAQRATAAVVVPADRPNWWSAMTDDRMPVVQAVLHLQPHDMWGVQSGRRARQSKRPVKANIVFFDFSLSPPARVFSNVTPSADQLARAQPDPDNPDTPDTPKRFLSWHH